jgi:hypothetical protein
VVGLRRGRLLFDRPMAFLATSELEALLAELYRGEAVGLMP